MSIFSLCKVSRQWQDVHHADVVLCTYPGTPSYKKNDLFDNDEVIYTFEEVIARGTPKALQLHIPEYASMQVFEMLKPYQNYLSNVDELRINIMNQNILMMPKPTDTARWFTLTPYVTQSTAHNRTASQEIADRYNFPTHLMSVFNDPKQYKWVDYEDKEKLIVLSPDHTDTKAQIEKTLKAAFPDYAFITIQNMSYSEYKETMSRARFAVTFGEGFDGYFIEAFFSGGITFAVYNEDFFPDRDFSKFDNTFDSYDDMVKNIVHRIQKLDTKAVYQKVVRQNYEKIAKLYDFKTYTQNLKKFYLGQFTFMPQKYSAERLIKALIEQEEISLHERDIQINQKDARIQELTAAHQHTVLLAEQKEQELQNMRNSHSWRITKPLRALNARLKSKS